jgi:hypothetical protein
MRYVVAACVLAVLASVSQGHDDTAKARIKEIEAEISQLREKLAALEKELASLRTDSRENELAEVYRAGENLEISVESFKITNRQISVRFKVKNLSGKLRERLELNRATWTCKDELGNTYEGTGGNNPPTVDPETISFFAHQFQQPVKQAKKLTITVAIKDAAKKDVTREFTITLAK